MLRLASFLAALLVYLQYVEFPSSTVKDCNLRAVEADSVNDSSTIKACEEFEVVDLTSNVTAAVDELRLRTDEHSVAKLGHVEGLKPESYNLSFHFWNNTHYEASVDIVVEVKEKTDRVVLNRHSRAPEIDYEKIFINSLCEDEKKEVACIDRVLVLNDSFVVQLTKFLRPGEKYVVTIPSFRSRSRDEFDETGSIGLDFAGSKEQGFWSLTTIFQMRYARTVFPCFDHPSMKAKFQVCILHPSRWKAASNTPLLTAQKMENGTLVRSCFEETPVMATYVFSIALMENYTIMNWISPQTKEGPEIELYAPTKKINSLIWIMQNAKLALRKMREITNVAYALPKLTIYVVYPPPFWGIENFGLVTVEGAFMEEGVKSKQAAMILNHEMVHQWLGNVATISEWREICLQEGLTAFLEWNLSQDLQNFSTQARADELTGYQGNYPPHLAQFNYTQHIADRCFKLPPLFFKLISDVYGFEVWRKFLNKLLTERAFGNADVKFWDKLLVNATGDEQLSGYLESWFGQAGFAYLFVSIQNEREIQITQGRAENFRHILVNNETVRPIPLTILLPNGQLKNVTVPRRQNFVVPFDAVDASANNSWAVLDPEGLVIARKVYEVKSYHEFLCQDNNCSEALTSRRLKSIWSDFCKGLLADVFPWGRDQENFDADSWTALFHSLANEHFLERGGCQCCVSREQENKQKKNCAWTWNQECRKLRINELLGRTYTMQNELPPISIGMDEEDDE